MPLELIDSNGLVSVRTDADVKALRDDGFARTIHLDANIALDLSRVGAGKSGTIDTVVGDLLQLAVSTDTAVDYDLAVEELATGAAHATGDLTRASTLRRDINSGIRLVETHLGLQRGSVCIGHIGPREVASYNNVHLGYYTHLLRIEQIAKTRPGRAAAVDNMSEYIRWANEELKSVVAHCLQVALDIFGGEPRAARLLGITSSKTQHSRAWNAAWDLVHAYAMQCETSRQVGHTMKRALLATRDRALSYVAQRCVVAIYVRDSPIGDTTLVRHRIDQPFFVDRNGEVTTLIAEVFASQRRRIERSDVLTRRSLLRMRDELEKELHIEPSARSDARPCSRAGADRASFEG